MLCQKCKTNTATIFIEATINDKSFKISLCQKCSSKHLLIGFSDSLSGDMVANFSKVPSVICPKCQTTLSKIMRYQRFGCARCYEIFGDFILKNNQLLTDILTEKAKLKTSTVKPQAKSKDKTEYLKELEQKLARAIEAEKYEEAAILRDEIKKYKNKDL